MAVRVDFRPASSGLPLQTMAKTPNSNSAPSPTRRWSHACARELAAAALCVATAILGHAEAAPTYRNLAKYQQAAGSTYGYTFRPEAFATDGIASNFHRWRTTDVSGHALEISYPRAVTIASAHLYSGVISTTTSEVWGNFKFQYHNGTTWVDISGGSVSGNTATERSVIFNAAATSSRFRLVCSDPSGVRSVRELAMFGPNLVGGVEQGYPLGTEVVVNLAHKRPATASSINGTNYAIKAVDGYVDDASRWLCTSGVAGEWLEIDLLSGNANGDAYHAISSARLYSGDFATSSNALSDFTLQYWDTVNSMWVAIPGAENITGNTQTVRTITFSSTVVTNKVRLVNNTTGSAKVAELQLFPPSSASYPAGQDVRMEPPSTAKWLDYGDATRHLRVSSASLKLGVVGGNAVFTNDSAGSDALNWQLLLNHRDGSYRIRNVKTGHCLALADLSTAANTAVIAEAYTGMPHQCWFLDFVNGVQFRLLNAYSGLALQSLGGSTTPGSALVVVAPGSSALQQWDTVWQANVLKKGIAATGNPFSGGTGESSMSYYYGKYKHSSWSYSWGRSDSFAFMDVDHTFNPMQWGNYFFSHGSSSSASPLEGDRVYLQSQSKPLSFMGFNEPDHTDQANMSEALVLQRWPRLQALDAPLVGPCPANPTSTWNATFYAAANQMGYRVDYTPQHWYSNPNANNLINKIKEVYNLYGRPVWLTEFSCVRWPYDTTSTWTYADNYNFLAEFLWRAENLPELARYSLFNWRADPASSIDPAVAPRGNAINVDGTLTPYGELYASWDCIAQVLPQKAYHLHNHGQYQRMQSPATGDSLQFVTPDDSSAGTQWFLTTGTTANTYRIQTTRDGRPLVCAGGAAVTMGALGQANNQTEWTLVPVVSGANHDGWYYLQHPLTNQRLKNNGGGACSMVAVSDTSNDCKWRFVVPLVPEMKAVADSATIITNQSLLLDVLANDGGRSGAPSIQSVGTPNAGTAAIENGKIRYTPPNGFSGTAQFTYTITDGTVTDSATVTLVVLAKSPPVFVANPFSAADATERTAYSATIASSATDADEDPLIYTKISGPAWLNVAADGTLSGTPAFGEAGLGSWLIRVEDPDGFSATATLEIRVKYWSGPITLVGGSVRNGDFNANPGATVNFQSTDFWYNTKGSQTTEATKDNDPYIDLSQNATVHANRGFGVDTGHIIRAGDSFDCSYVWKDAWQWVDADGEVTVALFVTSDDTITGTRTNLVVDYSGISKTNDTYESVSRQNVYTATEAVAGKVLFAAIETSAVGFARVDNFVLTVVVPTAYGRWTIGTFDQSFTSTDLTADPDKDGCTNVQEFAFDTDPTSPLRRTLQWTDGGPLTRAGLPVLMKLPVQAGPDAFHAVFVRRKDYQAAGLSYAVQFSADLAAWTPVNTGLAVEGENATGTMEVVSIPFPGSVPLQGGLQSAPPQFFRVAVSGN